MSKIYSVISDDALEEELIRGLKKRHVDQKFIYMDEGAASYYERVDSHIQNNSGEFMETSSNKFFDPIKKIQEEKSFYLLDDFFTDFMKNRAYWKYETCIISLGCGNANQEKELLKNIEKSEEDIVYFGIDTSQSMLELASENLKEINIEKYFLRADIMSNSFAEKINTLTERFTIRVLSFLGGTFTSPNQSEIAESLYNLMGENDLLWFNVKTSRKKLSENEISTISTRYISYLQNPKEIRQMCFPLIKLGITENHGELKLAFAEEKQVGALLFKYYFEFSEKTQVKLSKTTFTFLKEEKVALLNIRVYETDKFLEFMKGHGFHMIDKDVKPANDVLESTQFLFKKT